MSQVAKLNTEIEGIKQTMAQVEAQIAEKQALIVDLKESNSKLVQLSLGKERKPASLDVQRKKINDLNLEIEELKFVKERLDKELEKAKQELSEAAIRSRIETFRKAEAYQLSLIRKAQDLLARYANAISELEGSKNALELLVKINADLNNGKKLIDFGVDLETVLKVFNQHLLSFNFDSSKIERLNTANRNLLNQLDSINRGRRSFHNAQVQKGPVRQFVPVINPAVEARRLEESRKKSEQTDISRLFKPKKKVVCHTHR